MTAARFCFLTTFYPPYHFGGDAIGVQRLARAVARRGHHVTVIHDADAYAVLADGPQPAPTPSQDGVRVETLHTRLPMVSTLLTQQTGYPIVNGGRIRRLLQEGEYDVIIFNNVSLIGGPGLFSYGENAVKLYLAHEHWLICPTHVLWRHGRERCDSRECVRCQLRQHRPPQLWRQAGLLERQTDHIDAFIAMSEFSRTRHQAFGFRREMDVIPYFLPDDEVAVDSRVPAAAAPDGSPHGRPYFLFVGRLEKIKGLQDVIPLFRRYPDADLLVAGDGTYESTLRTLAQELPNVRFLGRVTPAALATYYRHALALIVPSLCYETFGIILIEAFRHGTPVIARRVGPFPEILEASQAGELFETPGELVDCMSRMQRDDQWRNQLGSAGASALRALWSERAVLPLFFDVVRRAAHKRGLTRLLSALPASPARPSESERLIS
jgi:glycosyltransferase involved in cell wall biosynthesis